MSIAVRVARIPLVVLVLWAALAATAPLAMAQYPAYSLVRGPGFVCAPQAAPGFGLPPAARACGMPLTDLYEKPLPVLIADAALRSVVLLVGAAMIALTLGVFVGVVAASGAPSRADERRGARGDGTDRVDPLVLRRVLPADRGHRVRRKSSDRHPLPAGLRIRLRRAHRSSAPRGCDPGARDHCSAHRDARERRAGSGVRHHCEREGLVPELDRARPRFAPRAARRRSRGSAPGLRISIASLPIVEYIFQWNGIGYIALQSIANRDPAAFTASALVLVTLFALLSFIADVGRPRFAYR